MIANSRPSYIQFYPTLSCNLACDFCFNKKLKPTRDINSHDFVKIVSILGKFEIPCIDIMGGEPTLHPELLTLVELVHQHGLKANISSNGTNVEFLEYLSDKYDRGSVRIGISINSHQPEKRLHDYILKHRPVLKSIFNHHGMILKSCQSYIGTTGIDYFLLFMDVMDDDDLKKSTSFNYYYKKLDEIKQTYKGVDGVFCSGFIPEAGKYPELKSVRCPAGTTKLSILPDGQVFPCYLFFRYPEFTLGNILCDDFDNIWRHPILDYFRQFEGNKCPKTECDLFASCHGGCPAMSFIFYNYLDGPDPRCMRDGCHDKMKL